MESAISTENEKLQPKRRISILEPDQLPSQKANLNLNLHMLAFSKKHINLYI